MSRCTDKKTILLSIKPCFFQKILDGDKDVELRKVCPSVTAGDMVLVYQSSPSMQLSAVFEIENISWDTPSVVWKTRKSQARKLGVRKSEFDLYFKGSQKAVCIKFKVLNVLKKPISLKEVRKVWPSFRPPQGFYYLRNEDYEYVYRLTGWKLTEKLAEFPPFLQHSLQIK